MSAEKKYLLLFVMVCILQACSMAHEPSVRAQSTDGHPSESKIRICQIKENDQNYLGSLVRVSGIYVFNGMNYSFLSDKSCGGNGLIVFDLLYSKSEEDSVVKARGQVANACNKITGYCNQNFFLDMRAYVKLKSNGVLVLVPEHIFEIFPVSGDARD